MSDETKLRACECKMGGDVRVGITKDSLRMHQAHCIMCGRAGSRCGSKDAAISAWNARADDDLVTALVEAASNFMVAEDQIAIAEDLVREAGADAVTREDWASLNGTLNYARDQLDAAIARAKQARGGGA